MSPVHVTPFVESFAGALVVKSVSPDSLLSWYSKWNQPLLGEAIVGSTIAMFFVLPEIVAADSLVAV